MRLEGVLMLALLKVPQANAGVFARGGHDVIVGVHNNLGYFLAMAGQGKFCGFTRQTVAE